MIENDKYVGPERRSSNLALDDALAEVQRLHNAATTLANAVANTANRGELAALREDVRKDFQIKLILQVTFTIVAIIILVFLINVMFNNMDKKIDRGHAVISCLLGKAEAQRTGDLTATALVTCQTVRR